MAKDVAAVKAVSQNLMHENLTVTDGVCGILSDGDVQKQIAGLAGHTVNGDESETNEIRTLLKQLLDRLPSR
jgi:hypothetical protein